MSRRTDALESVGFTPEQADMMVRVFDVADERVDVITVIDEGSPATRNEIEVLIATEKSVDPNFGGDRDIAPDVRLWNSRNYPWLDSGFEESIGTSAAICRPKRAYLPLERVQFWINKGGEIKNYDVWHEIADRRALCPYSVDDGEPGWVQESWNDWGVASNGGHAPVTIDGRHFRSNLYGDLGLRLDGSLWAQYVATPDQPNTSIIQMLTVEQFQEIQEAAAPPA